MQLHGINRDVWDRYTSKKPNWYYEIVAPGFKYNMPDIMAAMGIHQLKNVDLFQRKREEIARRYTEAFVDLPLRTPYVVRPEDYPNALHAYERAVSLPIYTRMTDADQSRVIDAVREVLKS